MQHIKFALCALVGFLFVAATPGQTNDFLEVRRSATVKEQPQGDAVILERYQPGAELPLPEGDG